MSFIIPAVFIAAMALIFAAVSNAASAKRGDNASKETEMDSGILCRGMGCSGCLNASACGKTPSKTGEM